MARHPGAVAPSGASDVRARAVAVFTERFGAPPPFVARAPGRVNLIGDHTDYNDGFVLPMTLDRAVWIAFRPRADRRVAAYSLDVGEAGAFDLGDLRVPERDGNRRADERSADDGWLEYIRGVAWALAESGFVLRHGWEGVIASDVPVGAGLSSSAALELAAARTFAGTDALAWEPARMARLAQRAENVWVGVNCGIMDQMISAAGTAGHALLIDCRSLGTSAVPMPPHTAVVVMDTATRRGLVDSAYNERRAQCEAAARHFGVPALRDVTETAFAAGERGLDSLIRNRARHVVTENARTVAAASALTRGDVGEVGRLMDASHASLRDDFEVSRGELDTIVALAQTEAGCYGARMTGAGFGGCAVALVSAEAATAFADKVARRYEGATGRRALLYVCTASDGASLDAA